LINQINNRKNINLKNLVEIVKIMYHNNQKPLNNKYISRIKSRLKIEKYQIVGLHTGVKKCRWLHESLVNNRTCYKQKFYGIESHRCIQMTPSLYNCTLRCLFCWRIQPEDLFEEPKFKLNKFIDRPDDPDFIVEECIKAQKRILSGYKVQNNIEKTKYLESLNPGHVAISLAGEPTLYPFIASLIDSFTKKRMTTFLVTNATLPNVISNLSREPTQLFVSLHAPNEKIFKSLCRPLNSNYWNQVLKTLESMRSYNCSTVIRLTLVKGFNITNTIDDYAKHIIYAEPKFIEIKAYMWIGLSRRRLDFNNMPSFYEVQDFALRLSSITNYKIINEDEKSKIVLLSK
jgi:tRNA wybutosine-synthesizing protein 1